MSGERTDGELQHVKEIEVWPGMTLRALQRACEEAEAEGYDGISITGKLPGSGIKVRRQRPKPLRPSPTGPPAHDEFAADVTEDEIADFEEWKHFRDVERGWGMPR